jgi:hypothetical protein
MEDLIDKNGNRYRCVDCNKYKDCKDKSKIKEAPCCWAFYKKETK